MSAAALEWRAYTKAAARYVNGLGRGVRIRRSTAYTAIVPTTEERVAELEADLRWETLLHDPVSLNMLEEMAAEALAEHKAGLTRDIDELL